MSIDPLPLDSDGDALRRLIAMGSDLSKAMEIDFAVLVPDEIAGKAFAAVVEPMGFKTSVVEDGEDSEDSEDSRWTCYCTCTLVPAYDAVIRIQKTLEDLGKPFDATPDGWGSFGNAETHTS